MNAPIISHNVPVDQLPEIARKAVWELHQNTKAPLGLIVPCVLMAMALSIQGIADVERLPGLICPLALWFLNVAESGERKTIVEQKVLASIREFETQQLEKYRLLREGAVLALKVWKAEEAALLKEIAKVTARSENTLHLKEQLTTLYAEKPDMPRRMKLLYDDATTGAIKEGMAVDWPSVGLISDEGSSILSGYVFRDFSFPNRAWGGATSSIERVNGQELIIRDPRFMFSISIQPGPLFRYCEKRGRELHESGFFARILFSYPPSTQGSRFIETPTLSWEHLPKFHDRIRELLELNLDSAGEPVEKMVLKFSPDAQMQWVNYFNYIESNTNPNGIFIHAKEYAAKIAENLARLAAVFHVFERSPGDISLGTLNRAYEVICWFANNYLSIFHPVAPIPPDQLDAMLLEGWLVDEIIKFNLPSIPKTRILQHGPHSLRKAAKLRVVLDTLYASGKVQFIRQGKRTYVMMTNQYWASRKCFEQIAAESTPYSQPR